MDCNAINWQGMFFLILSVFTLSYILFGAVSAVFYKPAPALDDEQLPGCTVIVPGYNEGRHVAETLESLLESDYPAEKMQIIAINDGSVDDTLYWIHHAEKHSNGRITSLDLVRNGGKKHALYRGIHLAENDIIITIDSDSIVTPESLRNIVSAFNSPDIGGVAGNIRIKNLSDGLIPRMMDVGFMFGFEIIRSAQSLLGCVMCTPGALSAYRKSIIMPFLDEWLDQKFLGVPATIGEDRAIATMILQHHKKIVFQSNAVAATCIPWTYVKFCKMLLRWMRSDIRENYLIGCSGLREFRLFSPSYWGFLFHLSSQVLTTILPLISLPVLILLFSTSTPAQIINNLYYSTAAGFITALIPAMIYAKRESAFRAVWALVYSLYGMLLLMWIPVYSFFTMRNSKWLTREITSAKKESPQPHYRFNSPVENSAGRSCSNAVHFCEKR